MTIPLIAAPVPISKVQGRYMVHSAAQATHLRKTHNITGVLIGNLPQAPQQNVFSGLPLELMPEEARLLIEKGAAYIVDDATAHQKAFLENGLSEDEKAQFRNLLERQGLDAAKAQNARAEERKASALQRVAEQKESMTAVADSSGDQSGPRKIGNGDMDNWNDMPEGMLAPRSRGAGSRTKSRRRGAERSASSSVAPTLRTNGTSSGPPSSGAVTPVDGEGRPQGPPRAISRDDGPPCGPPRSRSREDGRTGPGPPSASSRNGSVAASADGDDDETLFEGPPAANASRTASLTPASTLQPHGITPATSQPPLVPQPPADSSQQQGTVPDVPESYAVYKHMHDKGYFLAPGLRFGCQYMAYPGDPLRYHSHFLVNGKGWDEEFAMMEIVGGGRLGTGVKKGFLLGGEAKADVATAAVDVAELEVAVGDLTIAPEEKSNGVRAFSIEWAGM